MNRKDLSAYLDQLLSAQQFDDYSPNGLQVEGRTDIHRLVTGVTASQALLQQAKERGADALLVHHGYFWRGEGAAVVGMRAERLRLLLSANINLWAYHLPLDAHEQFGNNVQLAARLDLEPDGLLIDGCPEAGRTAHSQTPQAADELAQKIEQRLEHPVVHISPDPARVIERVGICTGAGQSFIEAAADRGLDAFISGEISEQTTHVARERGLHYFACGHHATERYGVQALGQHLAETFDLEHHFIDVFNPA